MHLPLPRPEKIGLPSPAIAWGPFCYCGTKVRTSSYCTKEVETKVPGSRRARIHDPLEREDLLGAGFLSSFLSSLMCHHLPLQALGHFLEAHLSAPSLSSSVISCTFLVPLLYLM